MSRVPLPALRKLFRAGGAPAASHAVLSRAPATERLLDPVAHLRLARESSFAALTQPLDVGNVLARVIDAAFAASSPGPNAGTERATAKAWAGRGRSEVSQTLTQASGPWQRSSVDDFSDERLPVREARGTRPARDPVAAAGAFARAAAGAALPEDSVPRRRDVATSVESENVATSHRRSAGGEVAGVETKERSVAASPASAALAGQSSQFRKSLSDEAVRGARARVVLHAPVADVQRLLAAADPAIVARAPSGGTSGATMSAPPRKRASTDAARLLADAIDRAAQRAAPLLSAEAASRRSLAPPAPFVTHPVPSRSATVSNAAVSEPSVGGFRGLALRTLAPNSAERHLAVRIEPESRVASDLTTDNLDGRVEESLARVLEREARRYGIDVAEART